MQGETRKRSRRWAATPALLLWLGACAAATNEPDEVTLGESGSDGGSESGGPDALTHGVIAFELHRSETEVENPFVGTQTIVATMSYESCLLSYYEVLGHRADRPEGALVFGHEDAGGEGWLDRLCDMTVPNEVECDAISIVQKLDSESGELVVTYGISTTDIEGHELPFGPLPTAETAMCPVGESPSVRFESLEGRDASGAVIWSVEAFSPTTASTGQGQPIRISAAAQ